MSEDLVHITIDGHSLAVPKGTLLVEAARQIGIEIPVYCYHPKMKPVGACRVCAVEVEKQRRPIMTACTTTVMPDMVVHTRSEAAIAAREGILEFLLINHPLDCPVCDRGGECDLQDFTLRYGPPTTRFVEEKRHFEKSKQVGQNVVLDRERCIMCQRCVRFCDEIAMDEGLVIIERGNRSEIGTFEGRSFDSQFSGNTIELCPVGALTAKTYRFQARPWEQQHYAGVCNSCSVGCNLTVDVRFDEVVRLRSRINDLIDDGWLCDRGRYSHLALNEGRLLAPQARDESGELKEISWEKAVELAAARLSEDNARPTVLLSSDLSVESGHAMLRLARGVLETADISHEHGHEAVTLEEEHVATGQIQGCDDADLIICVGCDPSVTHPVLDLRIKKGMRAGAKLAVLHPEAVLEKYADYRALGEPTDLWDKLIKAVKKHRSKKDKGLRIPAPRPWEAGGSTSDDWKALVAEVKEAEKVLVIVAGDLAGQGLSELNKSVADRNWNASPHGVLHLRTGANALGLDQVGCRPDAAPGGNELKEHEAYSKAWGTFNSKAGRSYQDSVKSGGKVWLTVDCDPMSVEGAKKPSYLIACATHSNATTEKADLVLPLAAWTESHGVYVNTDGTVQMNRQAVVPSGASVPAWQLALKLIEVIDGEPLEMKTARDVYAEVGRLNPSFLGASYRDFQSPTEHHWSYPQQADLGMPRPDLSAIPVKRPDAPMWMPAADTGSRVERAGRIRRGETPPAAPGQRDPREIAALLGLSEQFEAQLAEAEVPTNGSRKEGYVPLRVVTTSGAQPPGPTPAKRYHTLGVGRRHQIALPQATAVGLLEPEETPEESTEVEPEQASLEAEAEATENGSDEATSEEVQDAKVETEEDDAETSDSEDEGDDEK